MAERVKEYEVGSGCLRGPLAYRRRLEDGCEEGLLLPFETATEEQRARSPAFVELGFENGRPYVAKEVRYTARSRPVSNAYRSGWDVVYGQRTVVREN